MGEMVERVAKAMLRKRRGMVQWKDFPDLQAVYLEAARAALEELREPTELMVQKAVRAVEEDALGSPEDDVRTSWQVMIGAALA